MTENKSMGDERAREDLEVLAGTRGRNRGRAAIRVNDLRPLVHLPPELASKKAKARDPLFGDPPPLSQVSETVTASANLTADPVFVSVSVTAGSQFTDAQATSPNMVDPVTADDLNWIRGDIGHNADVLNDLIDRYNTLRSNTSSIASAVNAIRSEVNALVTDTQRLGTAGLQVRNGLNAAIGDLSNLLASLDIAHDRIMTAGTAIESAPTVDALNAVRKDAESIYLRLREVGGALQGQMLI